MTEKDMDSSQAGSMDLLPRVAFGLISAVLLVISSASALAPPVHAAA
ncbi:MAG: hypothetical protein ACRDHO_00680 [Actinomycetota bacterium]